MRFSARFLSAMCKKIFLFDVDGTLTKPRQVITAQMADFMKELKQKVPLAVVGGSDIGKIFEQLGSHPDEILSLYDFVFAENGLTGYHGKVQLPEESINKQLGEEKLQRLLNFCLSYMSKIELPLKRGTFVEFRKGMLNICPIGRSCSQAERDDYVRFESTNPVRQKFIEALQAEFADSGLKFSIGGQISIDVFPHGWDKTYCLRYLKSTYDEIHFFGDKTYEGGNDYEIFMHPEVIGHSVKGSEDTCKVVEETLGKL